MEVTHIAVFYELCQSNTGSYDNTGETLAKHWRNTGETLVKH